MIAAPGHDSRLELARFRGHPEAWDGGALLAAEFRRQVVELVRSGRRPEDLAHAFEATAQPIQSRARQAESD